MAIRKDANTLNSAERTQLVNALLQLKAEGIYDRFVLRHANANMMSIHRCAAFLPWHRRFLWDLEKELQRVSGNSDLGLPYWNWPSGGATASMWDDDLLGGDGNTNGIVTSGAFRQGQWLIVNSNGVQSGSLQRRLGRGAVSLPTTPQIQKLLRNAPYDSSPWNMTSRPSFRNMLEGWLGNGAAFHNLGHVWVGGSMLPMTSPNDPIFFMHHCMVDKLWHEWQLRFPDQGYLPVANGPFGQNLTDPMSDTPTASIGSRPIDVLDSAAIEIEYDQLLPGTPRPRPQPPAGNTDNLLTIDNATATPGQISTPGELDVFRFEVASFQEYVVETSGNSDTFITLSGPNDRLLEVARNDDGGVNLNSKITLNLSAGMYYVSVRLYSPSTIGDYAITVSSTQTASDIPQLIVDAPAISAAISVRNESDVYRFRVAQRASHTIETSGTTDTYLSLFGPNNESLLIQEDDDGGSGYSSRIRRVLSAGEYYTRVRHYSSEGTGAYSIGVRRE